MPNNAELARQFVSQLDQHSGAATTNDLDAQASLFHLFAPIGPDDGPEVVVDSELIRHLTAREMAAVDVARNLCLHANELFGYYSDYAAFVSLPEDRGVQRFFRHVGWTTQGFLHPENVPADRTLENYGEALTALRDIQTAADDLASKPRTSLGI